MTELDKHKCLLKTRDRNKYWSLSTYLNTYIINKNTKLVLAGEVSGHLYGQKGPAARWPARVWPQKWPAVWVTGRQTGRPSKRPAVCNSKIFRKFYLFENYGRWVDRQSHSSEHLHLNWLRTRLFDYVLAWNLKPSDTLLRLQKLKFFLNFKNKKLINLQNINMLFIRPSIIRQFRLLLISRHS